MKVGVFYFPTDYGINIAELAQGAGGPRLRFAVRARAHPHPDSAASRPSPAAASCPSAIRTRTIRSSALAFAAAATKKLKVGTGILLVPQHEPIATAKAIASLDQLSGGRFVFGIGAGWNEDEMNNHGVQFADRFNQMGDYVLAMKAIWTKDEAALSRQVREVRSGLVVAQAAPEAASADPAGRRERPHAAPRRRLLRRLVPAHPPGLRRRRQSIARLHKMAEKKGRDPKTLSVTVFGAPPKAEALADYAKAGIDGALLAINDDSRDDILRYLDKIAPLAKPYATEAA